MNNIMVDNWFMEQVVADLQDNKENSSKSYANLLMAIVLWDEVYYPKNSRNWWKSFPSQVQNAFNPIDDIEDKLFLEHKIIKNPLLYLLISSHRSDLISSHEYIGELALHYAKLSSKNGCDYLPCKKRQSFLMKYMEPQNIKKSLLRMKMQGNLDKSIEEYYTDTYKALLDFSGLKLKMPVLVNFIFDNTPKGMTPVDYAFHLKNEGAVIKYRKYLSEVEDALEKQNWKELRFLLSCSNDVISKIVSLDKKHIGNITVRILPTPSIILNGISADISYTPPFRKIHLTFLKDLTRYAINDMKIW